MLRIKFPVSVYLATLSPAVVFASLTPTGIILGTHREKGAHTFWSYALGFPLNDNSILCWKFCHVMHKVLRDGHRNVRHKASLLFSGKNTKMLIFAVIFEGPTRLHETSWLFNWRWKTLGEFPLINFISKYFRMYIIKILSFFRVNSMTDMDSWWLCIPSCFAQN